MRKIFFLCCVLILNSQCGIISRRTEQHYFNRKDATQSNKISMRSWAVTPSQIFPIVVEVAKESFPRIKIHDNSQKNRLHFWYLDSEQGDALIVMDVKSHDSASTLYLYPPRYGLIQPLLIRDPIPLKHFLKNLDRRIQSLGISAIFTKMDNR